MSLCIRCGAWKQVAISGCACGFTPARGSDDEARSFLLTTQFRTPEALEEARRAILAGEPLEFGERELALARTIGGRNARVTLAFLGAAILLGLALGSILGRMSLWFIGATAACAGVALLLAFRLMSHVQGLVAAVRSAKNYDSESESG